MTSIICFLAAVGMLLNVGCQNRPQRDPLTASEARDLFGERPSEVVRAAFDRYDPDIRREAVVAISAADFGGEPEYLEVYRLLLTDPDASVRAACVAALAEHGSADQDALRILGELDDPSDFLRWQTALALQHMYTEQAIEPLIGRLQEDTDLDVRMAAAHALGQYTTPEVWVALVGALDDNSYGVVQEARNSLITLSGRDFGLDAQAWLDYEQQAPDPFAQRLAYRPTPQLDARPFWSGWWFWDASPQSDAEDAVVREPTAARVDDGVSQDSPVLPRAFGDEAVRPRPQQEP